MDARGIDNVDFYENNLGLKTTLICLLNVFVTGSYLKSSNVGYASVRFNKCVMKQSLTDFNHAIEQAAFLHVYICFSIVNPSVIIMCGFRN